MQDVTAGLWVTASVCRYICRMQGLSDDRCGAAGGKGERPASMHLMSLVSQHITSHTQTTNKIVFVLVILSTLPRYFKLKHKQRLLMHAKLHRSLVVQPDLAATVCTSC